jgi:tRNA threonylcarbamoyladenosine biosynthesis protein TsaE
MKLVCEFKNTAELDLKKIMPKFASFLKKPAVIFLSADLGMGKTTFVSQFCLFLGIEHTSSPTFSIHNRYQSTNTVIDHFDLYRLETEEDVTASGFYDLMSEPTDFKIVEWPERLSADVKSSFGRAYLLQIKKSAEGESARDYSIFEI